MPDFKDFYKILGVAQNASHKKIKQAFRRLAKENHPDINPEDKRTAERFKEINEAWKVLGDSERRKEFDKLRAQKERENQARRARETMFGSSVFPEDWNRPIIPGWNEPFFPKDWYGEGRTPSEQQKTKGVKPKKPEQQTVPPAESDKGKPRIKWGKIESPSGETKG